MARKEKKANIKLQKYRLQGVHNKRITHQNVAKIRHNFLTQILYRMLLLEPRAIIKPIIDTSQITDFQSPT